MDKLIDSYRRIKNILGKDTEPLLSVKLVDEYRRYWKPDKINIVLLAESHVYTSDADRSLAIPSIDSLPKYPSHYARFIYCLAYGERELTNNDNHPRRGTPQFWKLFYSCNKPISRLEDFSPILRRTPYNQRISNKVQLLKDLRAKGVWLVDASIIALDKDKNKIPRMYEVLEESWKSYTRDIVLAAKPTHVICIGKGVARVVEHDLGKSFADRYTVVYQPNARLPAEEHLSIFKKCSKICLSNQ